MRLLNKRILVVGASSSIGKAICLKLAQEGAKLVVTFHRHQESLQAFVDAQQFGKSIEKFLHLDLALPLTEEFFKDVSLRNLDGLVIASGVHTAGPLISQSVQELQDQVQINLVGPMILIQGLLPDLIKNRRGSVVFIGSVAAHRVTRGHSVYSATKSGLEGFTRSLASELAKRHIRVNCLLPGPTASEMLQKSIDENGIDPQSMIPMGKLIPGQQIASMACQLLSDESEFVTGTVIPVDGGYLLW